jgi:hypothetical protein
MKSGVEQRVAESEGVGSSGASVDSLHPTSPQPDETVASSNKSQWISSQLPPPPAVVIPAPFHSHSAPLEGTVTHQLSDNGPAVDRSVFQAECHRPSHIPVEEDDCDSVPSDDDKDSDYLEDIESAEVLGLEEQLPPSKRRKLNQPLDGDLSESLGSDQSLLSARSPSQREQSREPTPKGPSLESEPIPVQGFLILQSSGSDVMYSLKFSQTHFASFFATNQTQEAALQTRRTRNSARRVRFSREEDALIIQLKDKMNLTWDEIEDRFAEQFSYRSKASLQGHYSSRLKRSSR